MEKFLSQENLDPFYNEIRRKTGREVTLEYLVKDIVSYSFNENVNISARV